MEAKISIIVPIYNGEKFLGKCIDSLIGQTYRNIEILLINDGSIDKSLEICNLYKNKDQRIKVIDKENEGVASARNIGIDYSTGEFITFVDCDDYLDRFFCEKLLELSLRYDADIIGCNFIEMCLDNIQSPDIFSYIEKDELILDKSVLLKAAIEKKSFVTVVWGKLFKRNVIKNIRFYKQKFAEDSSFVHDVIVNSNSVYLTKYKGYYYVRNYNSITIRDSGLTRTFDSMKTSMRLLEKCQKYSPELTYISMGQLSTYVSRLFCEMCKNSIINEEYEFEINKCLFVIDICKSKARIKDKFILLMIKIYPGIAKKVLKCLYKIKKSL